MRNPCACKLVRQLLVALLLIGFAETAVLAQTEQMPISLRQSIEMALANNKDVELARQTVLAADWELKDVLARYEPRSTVTSFYEHAKIPVNSFLSGGVNGSVIQSDLMAGYRLSGDAPRAGGSYEASFSSHRFTTNNIFAALNPQYPSELMFRYTQPLFRGRDFSTRLKDIEIAKKNSELTDTQFRKAVIEIILNVKLAYWDLVQARNNLSIQSEVLRYAQQQLDLNKRRAANGIIATVAVARPEARAAESEQVVYRSMEQVTRAENALKHLIVENGESRLWETSLTPTETLEANAQQISLQDALAIALENRLELQEADVVREINAIEQRYFRDQTRPQVDLTGSYGITGLGGSLVQVGAIGQLPLPGYLQGGYGQSLANLAQNRFSTFRVGVQIDLPLRNHASEAKLGRARVEEQRVITQREKLRQLIQLDVRNAYQASNAAESRRRLASVARSDFEQQYASDQRMLNVGYSTNDVVLEGQIALAVARIGELRAQTERNKALAELERAMGTGIEANRITIQARRPGD